MDCKALETSGLFRGLGAAEIEEALRGIRYSVQIYGRDEVILSPVEKAERVGLILRGSAQAQKLFPSGNQVNVTRRRAGDLIGAAAAFSDSRLYPCQVVALESAEVLLFPREELLGLLHRDTRLTENFVGELASAAFLLQQQLELLSYHGIDRKIAFYLLMQAVQGGGSTVTIPESISRWALMMNVSRPSLHRELRRLEGRGLLRYDPPRIELLDMAGLQAVLD